MFFIPFTFTKKSRYNSSNKVAVYFITLIIPLFLLSFLQNFPEGIKTFGFYISFLIALVSYVNFYEIGYIFNECETIKKEKFPTKRLTDEQLAFYERHKFFIYFERVLLSVILNIVLLFFISKKSVLFFSAAEMILIVIFFIYNIVRGKITQLVYLFLSIVKYTTLLFVHSENLSFSIFVAAVFVFPLVRTLEYKAHYGKEADVNQFFRKYIIKYDVSKITVFRVWATLILLIVSFVLYFLEICNLSPLICCLYIFAYRLTLFVAVKCGAKFNGYLKTDDNKKSTSFNQ